MGGDETNAPRREKAASPPAPDAEDRLSPAKVLRDNALTSRSERQGDSTPTGPATSPPVDPDTV